MNLLKGQKIEITKGGKIADLSFQFGWAKKTATMSIDAACFVLSDNHICKRDEDFIGSSLYCMGNCIRNSFIILPPLRDFQRMK